jgi:hypothetical protein
MSCSISTFERTQNASVGNLVIGEQHGRTVPLGSLSNSLMAEKQQTYLKFN